MPIASFRYSRKTTSEPGNRLSTPRAKRLPSVAHGTIADCATRAGLCHGQWSKRGVPESETCMSGMEDKRVREHCEKQNEASQAKHNIGILTLHLHAFGTASHSALGQSQYSYANSPLSLIACSLLPGLPVLPGYCQDCCEHM